MNIKRIRVVLPSRMSATAQMDARAIAEAAAKALHGTKDIKGAISVQVQGNNEPTKFISQNVYLATKRHIRSK